MAALVGGQIHLIGLWSPEIIEATHRRLDPASGTWTRLPDAPARMGLGKAVVWRDRIWIIGARRELPETTSDDVWIFDPAAPGGLTATRTRSAIMQRVEERTGGVMVLEPGACTDPARYGRRRPDRRDRRASGPEDDDP
jgi:hypothetical protein